MPASSPRRRFLHQSLAAIGLGVLATRASSTPGGAVSTPGTDYSPSSSPTPPGLPSPPPSTFGTPATFSPHFERIRREATPAQLYRLLTALPKGADLHHHLGGGGLAPRWFALATDRTRNGGQRFYTRHRILSSAGSTLGHGPHTCFWMTLREPDYLALPSELRAEFMPLDELNEAERAVWISSVKLDQAHEGRDEFFEYHWTRLNHLLTSIHVCSELVVENMRLMGAEGIRHLELMSGYSGWRDEKGRVLPPAEADAFWRARLARPDALATGVSVRFKTLALRFAPDAEDQVRRHFAYVAENRDLWVGIDIAGREDDNRGHPRRFVAVFDEMIRRHPGIGVSIHAGEAEKPDRHIFDSLRLGARRIGHAVNLIHDEETLLRLRDRSTLLEINLVSNHLLGYVPDPALHPFPLYLRHGIPCCLNTDDRGMWDSTATDEFFAAVTRYNLSWDELLRLTRASLEHAFIDDASRARLIREHETALAAFCARFAGDDWRAQAETTPAETYGYARAHLGLASLHRALPSSGPL